MCVCVCVRGWILGCKQRERENEMEERWGVREERGGERPPLARAAYPASPPSSLVPEATVKSGSVTPRSLLYSVSLKVVRLLIY